ncbi:hypothetical protein G7Y89_g319 [Cudoniella acicularis]|uniref:Carrier domain-containing protein n=1 Tax=Cudoniella acicularis TaxID=354080 RepID=A0A8H4RZ00_9HELO|nr:hypothetical protein G7Y89_g319 [Cudoniella acicularis]
MPSLPHDAIAVVGIGCRFPGGANDPEKFWSMLKNGQSAWSDVPRERFKWESFYHPDPDMNGSLNHRGGHFLDGDISTFDASFFGISAAEAHRLQLETAFEALENSGTPVETLKGSDTAVYIAIFSRDYDRMMYKDTNNFAKYHMTGSGDAILSNRISHVFDFKGPSMTLDTGCSGSMVALHQACQSLTMGETQLALVGGTNLILSPDQMIPMSLAHILNGDGKCYPFDSRGSGYGRGEGSATIVLKRLDDALSAGDNIRAVIRQTGVNQDGRTPGIAMPSQEAQESLIRSVYTAANRDPGLVDYVEAHGTGTIVGDSVEVQSIDNIFCGSTNRTRPLMVGSVKGNVGHLESASGIAGLIKTILVLEKGQIPATINLEESKSGLNLTNSNIKIPQSLQPWPLDRRVRLASVNSFGYGGTNAHAILESLAPSSNGFILTNGPTPTNKSTLTNGSSHSDFEEVNGTYTERSLKNSTGSSSEYTNGLGQSETAQDSGIIPYNESDPKESNEDVNSHLLVLSAKSEISLIESIARLQEWSKNHEITEQALHDLAFTLCCRRSLMQWRSSFVIQRASDLSSSLKSGHIGRASHTTRSIFIFTGQGAQWIGVGRQLLRTGTKFRESIEKSDRILQDFGLKWSLVGELLKNDNSSRINESKVAQPAITAVQIALVDQLGSMGIMPSAVVGHSSGEIAAAYASRALSQQMALKVSYCRSFVSELWSQVSNKLGSMMAVGLGEADISRYLPLLSSGEVTIACVNSPSSITFSGDSTAILELKTLLDVDSIFNRVLNVDTAYHSFHMHQIADQYEKLLGKIEFLRPTVSFLSSVTTEEKSTDFGPLYWVQNLVSKVRFSESLIKLAHSQQLSSEAGSSIKYALVEIGPHSALAGPIRQTLSSQTFKAFDYYYIPSLVRNRNAVHCVLELSGHLFRLGCPVDLTAAYKLSAYKKASIVSDLAPYQWDHGTKYWHESRTSKEHRLREDPYHDLLGTRIPGAALNEPGWSLVLGETSHPWLRDHIVDGFPVFPASGYACMAVEAIRQLLRAKRIGKVASKFVLRNLTFSRALIIPESPASVELQLHFRSRNSSTDKDFYGWEEFRISSISENGTCNGHCEGIIGVELESQAEGDEFSHEKNFQRDANVKFLDKVRMASTAPVEPDEMYKECFLAGNSYGPTFAVVKELLKGNQCAIATVETPNIASVMPSKFMQPHLIHPATLDATFQIGLPLYFGSCSYGSIMPVAVDQIAIDAAILSEPGQQYLTAAQITPLGERLAKLNAVGFQKNEHGEFSPVIDIQGAELRGVGEGRRSTADSTPTRCMVYRMNWKSDITSFKQTRVNFAPMDPEPTPGDGRLSPSTKETLLNRCASLYIDQFLAQVRQHNLKISKIHHQMLFEWLKKYHASEDCNILIQNISQVEIESSFALAKHAGVEGEMITRIGTQLQNMMCDEVDPLSILLEDNLLYRLYADDSSARCYNQLIAYLKKLTFKKPYLKVLEIGAGTGGTTLPLLQAHGESLGLFFRQYDYTDISPGFFEQATAKFMAWSSIMNMKTLDIEKDPISQGFEASSYDLVIASNVVHATKSLSETLANIRKLLKPDGQLALLERVILSPSIMVVFGLLPGWWAGLDDGRQDGPLLTVSQWDKVLLENSFSGTELVADDFEGPAHKTSLMITGPAPKPHDRESILGPIKMISAPGISEVTGIEASLHQKFLENGLEVQMKSWPLDPKGYQGFTFVVLDIFDMPLLANPSSEQFNQITQLLSHAEKVLWISGLSQSSDTVNSFRGLISGMAGPVRAENARLRFINIDVQDSFVPDLKIFTENVFKIIHSSFGSHTGTTLPGDYDYIYRSGETFIPRLIPDHNLNNLMFSTNSPSKLEPNLFHQPERPLKLRVETLGLLDSMIFLDDDIPKTALPMDALEIRVAAHGINFKDVWISLGQMKYSRMAGECAGTVVRVGSDLKDLFHEGDRVCCYSATPYASQARVRGHNAQVIPDFMSFTVAASIPAIFATAYHGLINIANLQPGQTVLIHAAAGGVGQAAIKVAQLVGANIFATVGSSAKAELLTKLYNIERSHIFSSRSTRFKQGILSLTQGRGVDVVLNSSSGENLHESWSCLARFGTFVEIGKTDIYNKSQLQMDMFEKCVTFSSVDLGVLSDHRPSQTRDLLGAVMKLFREQKLTPVEIKTMPIGDIELAFRDIQGRKHTGKVILEAETSSSVMTRAPKPASLSLSGAGTYVIAGGLGGLGRHIARLLAERGAGHIILLSRKAQNNTQQQNIADEIRGFGAELHLITCDIVDTASVDELMIYCKSNCPPIKGVIQAAMVLQDRLIEDMTLNEFNTAVSPKATGTKNLYDAIMGPEIDFFVMLSSVTGMIGLEGQANYAAGNGYLDYLANHRKRSGGRCISINVGMIADSNVMTSQPENMARLTQIGAVPLTVKQFLSLLENVLADPALEGESMQIVTGFDRESLTVDKDRQAVENATFSTLQHALHTAPLQEQTATVQELVLATADDNVRQNLICSAVSKKIAALIAHENKEIDVDVSLADLGLDSLVAIELKNWISRTLQAPFQTSEILDMPNISVLAATILARSALIQPQGSQDSPQVNKSPQENGVSPNPQPIVEPPANSPKVSLPQLPLPGLESTLNMYLQCVLPLTSSQELKEVNLAIEEFLQPDGLGVRLQERLLARANDDQLDAWQYDLYTKHVYLRCRAPINPFQQFAGWIPSEEFHHLSQADSAALISMAAINFFYDMETDNIGTDFLYDQPLCMFSLKYMFNTTREPHLGVDVVKRHPQNKYIIVLRHGHIFKVYFQRNGQRLSLQELQAIFSAILETSVELLPSLGSLTAEHRDTWAGIRERVKTNSPVNKALIEDVEASAFVVSLDDASPQTATERWNQYLLGNASNRWSDKSLQLVVCSNGVMGTIVEHSALDAGSAKQLHMAIIDMIKRYKSQPLQSSRSEYISSGQGPQFSELMPELDQQLKIEILKAEQRLSSFSTSIPSEAAHYNLSKFSGVKLRSYGCSPRTGLQLIIQLASRLYFGYQPPSWETVTLRTFHKGRVDIIQAVQPAVYAFCASTIDSSVPLNEQRKLFFEAAKEHTTTLSRVSRGRGFVGHLYALQEVCREDEKLPRLFDSDGMYHKTRPAKIMTDCVEVDSSFVTEAGFMMPDPDFIWVHYEVEDHGCKIYIKGPKDKTSIFFAALEKAVSKVEELLDSGE